MSRAKIWVLFCALVLVQRIQLNCSGFKMVQLTKRGEGGDNDSERDIIFSEDG